MALNITMHGKIGGDIIDLHPKTDVSQVEGLNSATTVSTEFLNKVSTSSPLAKIKKLEGKSVGVNQLVTEKTLSYTEKGITFDYSGASIRIHGTATGTASHWGYSSYATDTTHKYYINAISGGSSTTYQFRYNSVGYNEPFIANGAVASSGYIVYSGTIDKTFKPIILDLTLIFGSGNEPTTVDSLKSAWLTKFGYPLPTYIPYNSGSIVDCEIKGIGSTGKNLWNTSAYDNTSGISLASDGAYTGLNTRITEIGFGFGKELIGQTVTLSAYLKKDGSDPDYVYLMARINGAYVSSSTVTAVGEYVKCTLTVTPTTANDRYQVTYGNGSGTIYIKEPQLEVGSTATTYEPYSPYYRNFPIILRSAGNVKDTVEDTGNGYKVTRRVGSVDLGSLGWVSSVTVSSDVYRMCTSYTLSNIKLPSDSSVVANALCAKYETTSSNTAGTYGCHRGLSVAANGKVYVYDENYNTSSSATSFKTAMNGVMLNYELATPTTEYHSYNLTYPVTVNGTEYFDSPISVPCEIEYGVGALEDIVSGVVNSPTDLDRASVYASNPNLLDNGWFTVNQRGASSYGANVYTVDRWKNTVSTSSNVLFSVTSDGIKVETRDNGEVDFTQKFEDDSKILNKTITVSAIIDGNLYTWTTEYNGRLYKRIIDSTNGLVDLRVDSSQHLFEFVFRNTNSTHTVKAVKLELGSVSTLANDNAPDTKLETAKCMLATADGNDIYSNGKLITATTTVPTAAINVPKMAILSSEPATKYDGWIYFITD